jgi:thioredoxin 1
MADKGVIVHVNDGNFEAEVIKSDKPTLVDFWAPWCGPCKAIAPILEELAGDYTDRVKVAKLNVDENPQTATGYGVRSIPTLLLFKDGKLQDTLIGLFPKASLEDFMKKGL